MPLKVNSGIDELILPLLAAHSPVRANTAYAARASELWVAAHCRQLPRCFGPARWGPSQGPAHAAVIPQLCITLSTSHTAQRMPHSAPQLLSIFSTSHTAQQMPHRPSIRSTLSALHTAQQMPHRPLGAQHAEHVARGLREPRRSAEPASFWTAAMQPACARAAFAAAGSPSASVPSATSALQGHLIW